MRPHKIKTRKRAGLGPRLLLWLCVVAVVYVPIALQGEILYLKDGSSIRGSVVKMVGDTLTFDPAFGGRMQIARALIAGIVFSDSAAPISGLPGVGSTVAAEEQKAGRNGYLSVSFKDKNVSSKVAVESKKDEVRLMRANWIVQLLIVNGDTAFSHVDSTTDKTIYKGHAKLHKNNAELKDMEVPLKPGLHYCVVVVSSRGSEWENVKFETDPLDMSINIDNIQVFSDRSTRVVLGIKKGRFRLGNPELYRVQ